MKTNDDVNTGIPVQLTGEDGNAFSIIARCCRALRRGGRADVIPAFTAEAQSGDYDNVLRTAMKYLDVE